MLHSLAHTQTERVALNSRLQNGLLQLMRFRYSRVCIALGLDGILDLIKLN